MKTKRNEVHKPLLQRLGEGMLKAQQEIDELAVQLSLGKADARDKFEEIKRGFKSRLADLKQVLKTALNQPIPVDLKMKIQELELQLKVGKAKSKQSFDLQRQALIAATLALEEDIRKALQDDDVSDNFKDEVEKFLLKLEILRLKFDIKKFEIKDAFRAQMKKVSKSIGKIAEKANQVAHPAKGHETFRREITAAYKSLKGAVKHL